MSVEAAERQMMKTLVAQLERAMDEETAREDRRSPRDSNRLEPVRVVAGRAGQPAWLISARVASR